MGSAPARGGFLAPIAVTRAHGHARVHVQPRHLRGPRALRAGAEALVIERHGCAVLGEPTRITMAHSKWHNRK
jgi:hypothetical protein